MDKVQQQKIQLRKQLSDQKAKYSADELAMKSQEVFSVLEITGVFQEAKNVFIYHNMKDEVATIDFIQKWEREKDFYLPVVVGYDLIFRKYTNSSTFDRSSFGILEPQGTDFTNYQAVDLVVVPGVAFDRGRNRLGHGKGYYDRFLPLLSAPKVGVCFDFQLFDSIPSQGHDIKMDYIVSEDELIW